MLKNLDPLLTPELLYALRAMGHGDKLILCDSNFPAYSMNSLVHRLDGVDAARAAKAILSIFPLDSFVVRVPQEPHCRPAHHRSQK